MSKEKLTPKLKFKDSKKDFKWKLMKLGDIGNTFNGLSGKSKKDFGHGNAEFVTYMNVFNNTITNVNLTERVEIDKTQNEVQYGDVFFTTSSETPHEVGMSSVWLDSRPNVYLNSFCFGFRPLIKLSPYYLAYMLKSPRIRQEFIFLAQGISRYNISKTKAMEISVWMPNISEQMKIGKFFKKLDQMIQLQQSKVNKVKDVKSAYLSEMFPKEGEKYPKKRFEGFTEPWQLFKLGELGQFRSNGVNKKIRANDNPAYLLNYMDVYNKLSINQMNYKDLMKVTATSQELQENNIMKNDVFFTPTSETADDIGRVLTIKHDLPETVYSYHLIRFRPFEDKLYSIFPNYGFATKYLRKQMEIAAQGVQRFVISVTAFKDLKVYLPSYEEQIEIAEFFENLDNQILLEEEKLMKLQKLKQAYLNDMFV